MILEDYYTKDGKKKELSNLISNKNIDYLYDQAIKYGALGGKLLGAGGGGFLLMYMKKIIKKNFLKNLENYKKFHLIFMIKGVRLYSIIRTNNYEI